MSAEQKLRPADLERSRENLNNGFSRYLIQITERKHEPLMAFLEINTQQVGLGDIAIPLRYLTGKVEQISRIDTLILSTCLYNQKHYRGKIDDKHWANNASEVVLALLGLSINQNKGPFEITSATIRVNGIIDERIYFKATEGSLVTKETQKLPANIHTNSAMLLGEKFQRFFPSWILSPFSAAQLQREVTRIKWTGP